MSTLAMIVAASTNDVIGVDGDLPWHISADLKRFKKLTMGHHLIMGRKTFESIGKCLPGRTTVIVTRQADFSFPEAKIAHTIESAIEQADGDESPFIVGGAEIYSLAMPHVDRIYLTRVHQEIDGDTHLPAIDWGQWELIQSQGTGLQETKTTGSKDLVKFTFEDFRRNSEL